jgi:hypothetical protein
MGGWRTINAEVGKSYLTTHIKFPFTYHLKSFAYKPAFSFAILFKYFLQLKVET